MIPVERVKCCTYRVCLGSDQAQDAYRVLLDDAFCHTLARGRLSKERLLQTCFSYFAEKALLDQLPLRFSLREISGQFPQFVPDIQQRTASMRRE